MEVPAASGVDHILFRLIRDTSEGSFSISETVYTEIEKLIYDRRRELDL